MEIGHTSKDGDAHKYCAAPENGLQNIQCQFRQQSPVHVSKPLCAHPQWSPSPLKGQALESVVEMRKVTGEVVFEGSAISGDDPFLLLPLLDIFLQMLCTGLCNGLLSTSTKTAKD